MCKSSAKFFSDTRDYDPRIVRIQFNKTLYPYKFRRRTKQLSLWEVTTMASYYKKLIGNTRPRNIQRTADFAKKLDTASDRIDAAVKIVIFCVHNLMDCLKKQHKSMIYMAHNFRSKIKAVELMRDNFSDYHNLAKQSIAAKVDIMALARLVRVQKGTLIISANESWSVKDLKNLPAVANELDKIVKNFNNLRTVRKLIEPTNLPEEKEITKLIEQAQQIRQILEARKNSTRSSISIIG
ncbi:unnamed protein product [Thelazia callipaeda]|uniref:Uncharacterized protein n=1 Tax=Thelazia callipaeda TaxID=103827 RepID=A0A3P7MWH2_THECL|nr:unnamed protein product [Thelazia callipaeda]